MSITVFTWKLFQLLESVSAGNRAGRHETRRVLPRVVNDRPRRVSIASIVRAAESVAALNESAGHQAESISHPDQSDQLALRFLHLLEPGNPGSDLLHLLLAICPLAWREFRTSLLSDKFEWVH